MCNLQEVDCRKWRGCKNKKKGADGINSASEQRGDNVVAAGDTVNKTCLRDFINKKDIEIDKKAKLDSAPAVK